MFLKEKSTLNKNKIKIVKKKRTVTHSKQQQPVNTHMQQCLEEKGHQ